MLGQETFFTELGAVRVEFIMCFEMEMITILTQFIFGQRFYIDNYMEDTHSN